MIWTLKFINLSQRVLVSMVKFRVLVHFIHEYLFLPWVSCAYITLSKKDFQIHSQGYLIMKILPSILVVCKLLITSGITQWKDLLFTPVLVMMSCFDSLLHLYVSVNPPHDKNIDERLQINSDEDTRLKC